MRFKGTTQELIKLLHPHGEEQLEADVVFLDGNAKHNKQDKVESDMPGGQKNQPPNGDNTPLLLDADAVAVRLGLTDRKSPRNAVKYLHRTKQLVGILVQGRFRWRPEDVEAYVKGLK